MRKNDKKKWLDFSRNVGYYEQILKNKLMNTYKIEGAPDTVDVEYLKWNLIDRGYCIMIKNKKGELRAFTGALVGIDCYNLPVTVEVANPVDGNLKGTIGKDCVVVYNTWNKWSPYTLEETISKYAYELAQIDQSINVNLYNSKVSTFFPVSNERDAQRIRKMYDDITDGSPAVALLTPSPVSSSGFSSAINVKNDYIVDKLIEAKRAIYNEFDAIFGISNVQYEKKERLVSGEVDANDIDNFINGEVIISAWRDGLEKTNEIFGTDFSVSLNQPEKEVMNEDRPATDEQPESSDGAEA